jgi:hypothetical protein
VGNEQCAISFGAPPREISLARKLQVEGVEHKSGTGRAFSSLSEEVRRRPSLTELGSESFSYSKLQMAYSKRRKSDNDKSSVPTNQQTIQRKDKQLNHRILD